jgi:hypothetical protein
LRRIADIAVRRLDAEVAARSRIRRQMTIADLQPCRDERSHFAGARLESEIIRKGVAA